MKLHLLIALRMAFVRPRPHRWHFRKYTLEPRLRVLEVERQLRNLLRQGAISRGGQQL